MRRFWFSLFWLAICPGIALAQHPDNSVNEGAPLFAQHCSACHGDTAKGGRGSDLTSGQWKHGGSDEEIVRNTIKGIPGTQMPAIPLSEADARKIVAFLRALAGKAKLEAVTGDVEAGRRLFFGAAKCSTCHMFGGRGDILAADLTDVRARRSFAEIAQRMQAPIKLLEGRPRAGVTVRGIKKGEDTFTLRLLDDQRKWHFLDKRAASIKVSEQPHPILNAKEREDGNLIALEARTGKYLWHYYTGAHIVASPMAYAVNGKQYVAIASQSAIFVFALP
jgi:mono/diheme cytochrome c family protein